MVQQTPVFTEGPRPPLGVLLLDDGSAFQLDSDYVLGREPAYDDDVRTGRLRGIVVNDPDRSVSRAHARIELRQWDVVLIDNSSANGTYVAGKDENHWKPLTPGTAHPLTSGSRIRLGSRTLAFNFFRGE
jgi:pSer/pThr/pTyr-binding forkhead associated (FHA) protein